MNAFAEQILKATTAALEYADSETNLLDIHFTEGNGANRIRGIFTIKPGRGWDERYLTDYADAWTNSGKKFEPDPDSLKAEAVERSSISDTEIERYFNKFKIEPRNAPKGDGPDWRRFLFDFSARVEAPAPLLTRDGIPVASRATLTMIAGEQKSGKSYNAGLMMAAAVGGVDCFGYDSPAGALVVVALDTEMSPEEVKTRFRSVFTVAGLDRDSNPRNLSVLRVRECDPRQKLDILNAVVSDVKPDLVFIDGAVDLVSDFNDPAQSKELVDEFLRLCDRYNCGVVVTIHNNKDEKGRAAKPMGHVGSTLSRKDSSYILVRRNGPIITVSNLHSRGRTFTPFSFTISEDGTPQLVVSTGQQEEQPEAQQKGPRTPAIYAEFRDRLTPGQCYKLDEIVKLCGGEPKRSTVTKYVKLGQLDGIFTKVKRGVYAYDGAQK